VGSLTIDGSLRLDDRISEFNIEAGFIWVRGGKLAIGYSDNRYTGKLTITLTGTMNSPDVVIDSFANVGNKVIAVTGRLELFGSTVESKYTRLTANVKPGDNSLTVISSNGWVVGDEIAVGPSKRTAKEAEKFKITAINGNTITLNDTAKYFHYGFSKATVTTDDSGLNQISSDYGGGLDMRAIVGHLTRNIKIQGSSTDNWGGHIYVYHWIDDK